MTMPYLPRKWHAVLATALIAVAGAMAFGSATRGFEAVTSDGVRRIDLARMPRTLPPIMLVDSTGKKFALSEINANGKRTFITLAYTQCMTICRTTVSGQAYLQGQLQERGLDRNVHLLTISFDPLRDTPAALKEYGHKLTADPDLWTFATVANPRDLANLLKLFEIVVLPDGLGGYVHNAALFLASSQGKLVRAYDIDRPDTALADLLQAMRV